MAFKPLFAHASYVFDIASFGEIGEMCENAMCCNALHGQYLCTIVLCRFHMNTWKRSVYKRSPTIIFAIAEIKNFLAKKWPADS